MNIKNLKPVAQFYNVAVVVIIILFLSINWSILVDLWHKWTAFGLSGPFAHGPLLVVIALWIAYQELKLLPHTKSGILNCKCLVLLGGLAVALFVTHIIDIDFLEHILLVASLAIILWCAYSYELFKKLIYPFLLLSFSLPVWGFLSLPLQTITTHITNLLLSATTIPFYREGYYFYFPNGIFEVASGCSGLQQFLVSMVLGIVLAYQQNLKMKAVIKLLLYLVCFAIIVNAIRVFTIMIIGYQTEMRSTIVEEHVLLGWLIYGIGIILFFIVYNRFDRESEQVSEKSTSRASSSVDQVSSYSHRWFVLTFLAGLVLLPYVAYVSFVYVINNQTAINPQYNLSNLNYQVLSTKITTEWHPQFPRGDALITEEQRINGKPVFLYINHYARIQGDIEPINITNYWYDPETWAPLKTDTVSFKNAAGKNIAINLNYVHSASGKKMLILGWFDVNGKATSNLGVAKLYTLFGALKFKYDMKAIAIATYYDSDPQDALRLLEVYYRSLSVR